MMRLPTTINGQTMNKIEECESEDTLKTDTEL